jgi:hypothetical protein
MAIISRFLFTDKRLNPIFALGRKPPYLLLAAVLGGIPGDSCLTNPPSGTRARSFPETGGYFYPVNASKLDHLCGHVLHLLGRHLWEHR